MDTIKSAYAGIRLVEPHEKSNIHRSGLKVRTEGCTFEGNDGLPPDEEPAVALHLGYSLRKAEALRIDCTQEL